MEVSTLARLRHGAIVRLLGVCIEGDQRVAVFELLQGSLAHALEPPPPGSRDAQRAATHAAASTSAAAAASQQVPRAQPAMSWRQRLRVALDVAQGLAYLHQVHACIFIFFRPSLSPLACLPHTPQDDGSWLS